MNTLLELVVIWLKVFLRELMIFKVVRNKKSKFFSHRYLIEFYETNRMSHVPHLYDVVNLLK